MTFPQIDQYVFSLVQNMVDNVCLHEARVDQLTKAYEDVHGGMNDSHATGGNSSGAEESKNSIDADGKELKKLNERIKRL